MTEFSSRDGQRRGKEAKRQGCKEEEGKEAGDERIGGVGVDNSQEIVARES